MSEAHRTSSFVQHGKLALTSKASSAAEESIGEDDSVRRDSVPMEPSSESLRARSGSRSELDALLPSRGPAPPSSLLDSKRFGSSSIVFSARGASDLDQPPQSRQKRVMSGNPRHASSRPHLDRGPNGVKRGPHRTQSIVSGSSWVHSKSTLRPSLHSSIDSPELAPLPSCSAVAVDPLPSHDGMSTDSATRIRLTRSGVLDSSLAPRLRVDDEARTSVSPAPARHSASRSPSHDVTHLGADSQKKLRLKCKFNGTIRAVAVTRLSSLRVLQKRLEDDYGFPVTLQYEDEDSDLCELSTQNDLNELIEHHFDAGDAVAHIIVSRATSLEPGEEERVLLRPIGQHASSPAVDPAPPAQALFQRPGFLSPLETPAAEGRRADLPSGAPSSKPRAAESSSSSSEPIRWKRGARIGQGAVGTVYQALNLDTGEIMAVKLINASELSTKDLAALEQEVQFLRSFRHPNIVRYYGAQRSGDSLCIFLEYIPGGSVKMLLDGYGGLAESIVRRYTRYLLLGLEYLHRNGIAHRDIKGGNILVNIDGVIKLADFGASKRISLRSTSGTTGVQGTPQWMAPEVIKEQIEAAGWRKADIWSVGCTVIEMITAQPPWPQFPNPLSAMYHIARTDKPPAFPPSLSKHGVDFLTECLKIDPSQRPDVSALLLHPFVASTGLPSIERPFVSDHAPRVRIPARPSTGHAPSRLAAAPMSLVATPVGGMDPSFFEAHPSRPDTGFSGVSSHTGGIGQLLSASFERALAGQEDAPLPPQEEHDDELDRPTTALMAARPVLDGFLDLYPVHDENSPSSARSSNARPAPPALPSARGSASKRAASPLSLQATRIPDHPPPSASFSRTPASRGGTLPLPGQRYRPPSESKTSQKPSLSAKARAAGIAGVHGIGLMNPSHAGPAAGTVTSSGSGAPEVDEEREFDLFGGRSVHSGLASIATTIATDRQLQAERPPPPAHIMSRPGTAQFSVATNYDDDDDWETDALGARERDAVRADNEEAEEEPPGNSDDVAEADDEAEASTEDGPLDRWRAKVALARQREADRRRMERTRRATASPTGVPGESAPLVLLPPRAGTLASVTRAKGHRGTVNALSIVRIAFPLFAGSASVAEAISRLSNSKPLSSVLGSVWSGSMASRSFPFVVSAGIDGSVIVQPGLPLQQLALSIGLAPSKLSDLPLSVVLRHTVDRALPARSSSSLRGGSSVDISISGTPLEPSRHAKRSGSVGRAQSPPSSSRRPVSVEDSRGDADSDTSGSESIDGSRIVSVTCLASLSSFPASSLYPLPTLRSLSADKDSEYSGDGHSSLADILDPFASLRGVLISGTDDGSVWVWDIQAPVLTAAAQVLLGAQAESRRAKVAPIRRIDVHRVAVRCLAVYIDPDHRRTLLDTPSKLEVDAAASAGGGIAQWGRLKGVRVVSGAADGTIRVLCPSMRKSARSLLRGHSGPVLSVVVLPGGKQLLSSAADKTIRLWDLASGVQRGVFDEHLGAVNTALMLPSALRAIVTNQVVTQDQADESFEASPGPVIGHGTPSDLLTSPDDFHSTHSEWREVVRHLEEAVTAGNKPFVEDLGVSLQPLLIRGDGLHSHVAPLGPSKSAATLPSIVSSSSDKSVKIWTAQGACLFSLREHQGAVTAIALPPVPQGSWVPVQPSGIQPRGVLNLAAFADAREASGGGSLLTSSNDGTMRLWDVGTGRLLRTFRAHKGAVTCVAWGAPGQAATGGADGTVRLWSLAHGTVVAEFPAGRTSSPALRMESEIMTDDDGEGSSPPRPSNPKRSPLHPPADMSPRADGEASLGTIDEDSPLLRPARRAMSPIRRAGVGGLSKHFPPALSTSVAWINKLAWEGSVLCCATKTGAVWVMEWSPSSMEVTSGKAPDDTDPS
jgi:serine/threonine protein kinase/WD40 repeat protein